MKNKVDLVSPFTQYPLQGQHFRVLSTIDNISSRTNVSHPKPASVLKNRQRTVRAQRKYLEIIANTDSFKQAGSQKENLDQKDPRSCLGWRRVAQENNAKSALERKNIENKRKVATEACLGQYTSGLENTGVNLFNSKPYSQRTKYLKHSQYFSKSLPKRTQNSSQNLVNLILLKRQKRKGNQQICKTIANIFQVKRVTKILRSLSHLK